VPQKELEEISRCQTEDPMQEGAARGLSKVEQAKRSYYKFCRRMPGDSE